MKKLSAFRLDKQGRMRDKADPTDPVSELEELVEKQELTSTFHASNYMSRAALYEQLAEEASELSAASLKTARALRAENPTFIAPGDASLVVEEKYSGVSVVAKELHIFPSLMEMADKKVRMAQRIERYYGADKSGKNETLTGEEVRTLLLKARSFEEVDGILSDTWCKTDGDKVEYIRQLFGSDIIFDHSGDIDKYADVVGALLRRKAI